MTADDLLYLDRFEGDRAVLILRREEFSIPRSLLPAGTHEGDYLDLELSVRPGSRDAAGDEVSRLQQRLRQKGSESE